MPHDKAHVKRQLQADGALAVVTLIWGSTFPLVKDVVQQVPPMTFLSVRFMLGAVALAIVTVMVRRWRGLTLRELRWGLLIGLFLWVGYALQTIGLQFTTASNGGFITGLSVVFVPIFGFVLFRQKPRGWALLGVVMATVGLALLSLRIEEGVRVNVGDALVFGCALAFAMQIVAIAHVASWADPFRLALVQITTAGMLNAVSALVVEKPLAGLSIEIWASAAFLGIAATTVAIVIQVSVQRFTTAVHTALIFTLEPVFAAMFGVWLQGDRLGFVALTGAVLILSGMLVAELAPQLWAARQSRRVGEA